MREANESVPTPLISVVIPAYNEEGVLRHSIPKIIECLLMIEEVRYSQSTYEVLIVNDGSSDKTESEALILAKEFREIRLLTLAKNAGHMRALEIGLLNARGNYIISLDADLQDPPEYIPALFRLIQESDWGCVQTVRMDRKSDTFLKRNSAGFFYWIFRRIIGIDIIPHAADYRILTAAARDKILQANDKDKVFRFLIPILRIPTNILPIHRSKRISGVSKYHLRDMAKLASYSIVNYTRILIRISRCALIFAILGTVSTLILSGQTQSPFEKISQEDIRVWLIIFSSVSAILSLLLFGLDRQVTKKPRLESNYVEVV